MLSACNAVNLLSDYRDGLWGSPNPNMRMANSHRSITLDYLSPTGIVYALKFSGPWPSLSLSRSVSLSSLLSPSLASVSASGWLAHKFSPRAGNRQPSAPTPLPPPRAWHNAAGGLHPILSQSLLYTAETTAPTETVYTLHTKSCRNILSTANNVRRDCIPELELCVNFVCAFFFFFWSAAALLSCVSWLCQPLNKRFRICCPRVGVPSSNVSL